MVSDILSQTAEDLTRYLESMPDAYPPEDPITAEIRGIRDWAMLIRMVLDTPPGIAWTLAPVEGWKANPLPLDDLDIIVNTPKGPIIGQCDPDAPWISNWSSGNVLAIRKRVVHGQR